MSFSVVTEKWIPVTYLNGKYNEISIRDAFKDAHEIKCVADENEMTNLGILRLLTVFFMDIYKMERAKDRMTIFYENEFDMLKFDSYIHECEKIGNCFDLFDNEVPFLQTGDISMEGKNICSAARIGDFECSGAELTFFNGMFENFYSFTPVECARRLCQRMTTVFKAMQGGGFQSFNPLLNAVFMLNKGRTLKDTIILNSISKREWISCPRNIFKYGTEDDMKGPHWRQGVITDLKDEKVDMELSLLSMMTFLSTNIKMILDEDGYVRKTYYTKKIFKSKEKSPSKNPFLLYEDPMVVIRINKKQGGTEEHTIQNLNPAVGFWEVLDALRFSTERNIIKPLVLQTERPLTKEGEELPLQIETWSPCKNDKAKGIVYHDSFEIRSEFLNGISETMIMDDSENFARVINNFNNKKMKNEFEKLQSKKNYIYEMQRKMRQYMNVTYLPKYIKGMSELNQNDLEEWLRYTSDFAKETINVFHEIAKEVLERVYVDCRHLKAKEMCRREIDKYFNTIKKKQKENICR